MNPRVGGDLHPYVGDFSKGTADNLSTEDNIVHVTSGTPTPDLPGSDYVPTKNLEGCISLPGNESGPTKTLKSCISPQGTVSSTTNNLRVHISLPENALVPTKTDWRGPCSYLEDLGRQQASSCVRSTSDAWLLNLRSAISVDYSSPSQLSVSTEALKTRSLSMVPEDLKNCSAFRSVGRPITAKLRNRSPRSSASQCPYQVMLQLGAEPVVRRKAGVFATRSLSNLRVPFPLPATRHEILARQLSTSSASWVSIAARHRSKSSKCGKSTEDMTPFLNGVVPPLGIVGRQRYSSSRNFMSTPGLSAKSNVTSVGRQLSNSSQSAISRQLSTGSRTLCWATPLQVAVQHGSNSTAPFGCGLPDKSRGSPSGQRWEMNPMWTKVGEEEVEKGHAANEISSPPAEFLEEMVEGGKCRLEKEKVEEVEPAQKKKSTSLFSKFKRKLKKMLS
eukprot:gene8560-33993_t